MNTINEQQQKQSRAKRSDLDAMQARFSAIITVVESIADFNKEDLVPELWAKLRLVVRLADGASLDEVIQEEGRRALGLDS